MNAPYDKYVGSVLNRLFESHSAYPAGPENQFWRLREWELRGLLADAWLNGLEYSLEIIDRQKCPTKAEPPFQHCTGDGPKTGMYGLLLDTDKDKIIGGKLEEK